MADPKDQELYDSVKKRIYAKNPQHSAYRSGMLVKEYKEAYKKKYKTDKSAYKGEKPKEGLSQWFKEEWQNQRGETGYKQPGDVYRPTVRINKDTPKTFGELTKTEITKAIVEKKATGRVKKF